jgi:dipeptidyl aminopeptidase/acylaminoacyl peptidase
VQVVACFFPPTDFLNFGKPGKELLSRGLQPPFTAAVDLTSYDKKKALFVPITDVEKQREIMKDISPAWHVSKSSAPTLILHGDKDTLVPLQQSELMVEKLKKVGVPAELIVRKGAGHGWLTLGADLEKLADWFDKYLGPDTNSK